MRPNLARPADTSALPLPAAFGAMCMTACSSTVRTSAFLSYSIPLPDPDMRSRWNVMSPGARTMLSRSS